MKFLYRSYRNRKLSRHFSTFQDKCGIFTNGKIIFPSGCQYFDVNEPATGNHLCKVVSSSQEDVASAINVAYETFVDGIWSRSDVRKRSSVLYKIADNLRQELPRLAEMEVLQTGRPLKEMKAQLARLPEWFEYFGSLIRTQEGTVPPFFGPYLNYVKRVPLGVVAQLTPWNHPMLIAIKKLAPALATGNSVVVKPSELAPVTVTHLAQLIVDSGVPSGAIHVLPGLGSQVGQYITQNSLIRKVDLTGGTPTGRVVGAAAGANLASVVSELGGKAPMVVFEDAPDVEEVVNGVAFATFIASGQTCVMGARLLVHESIYSAVVSQLVSKVRGFKLGDPTSLETQMGPVISMSARDRIHSMVMTAKDQGGKILCGGEEGLENLQQTLEIPFRKGSFYPPTIIETNNKDLSIWRDEVFGPVLVCRSFKTEEEAIRLANDSPFGLAATIWTKDVMRAHRVADKLDVGIIWINDHHRNDPSSPWGGMKDSGIGRENGLEAFHEYTQTKSVVVRTDPSKFDWFENKNARYS